MNRRPLRTFAYGHPWFYDLVTGIGSLQWFVRLFETETAVDFLTSNLSADLTMTGYGSVAMDTLAMGSLQLVSARKPFPAPVS